MAPYQKDGLSKIFKEWESIQILLTYVRIPLTSDTDLCNMPALVWPLHWLPATRHIWHRVEPPCHSGTESAPGR